MSDAQQSVDIAIVGISCKFPGADGPEEFWRNIRDGVDSLTRLTDEEILASGVDEALMKAPNYVKVAACIEDVDLFDAGFFGMSPREAELMDPQQRLFLEHCWRAMEAGGYAPDQVEVPVGVYGGAGVNSYIHQIRANAEVRARNAESGNLHDVGSVENDLDYLTTRVSYKLNLTGPSVNVSTACSTSLVAVHMAAQALRTFECDMALAGGVAVTPPLKSGYLYQEGAISSFDGLTRSFDASSTGTVLGSGVGVVLLKRLEDAQLDGDVIHGVILGSAINNDGSNKAGFTAPGIPGQAEVTANAHAVAGVSADTITYQEAHGTGTLIGDPIEVQALTQAYRETTDRRNYCALGSVKANIGHMDTGAGVAALIKAVMAAKHGVIPPQINFEKPNPGLGLAESPFYITGEARPWGLPEGMPRRAGVSAFGFGGTNAHVVVEEPPAPLDGAADRARESAEDDGWQILPVSARGGEAVGDYLRSLAEWIADPEHADRPLHASARTLQRGRSRFGHRAAVVARSRDEAVEALRSRAQTPAVRAMSGGPSFLFPGQGSQYARMGRELYEEHTVFRAEFDRCAELFHAELGVDLAALLHGPDDELGRHPVNETWLTQPALFAVEYALVRTLEALGIRPQAMIGHSLGEIVAATVAGVFELRDAVRVVAKRAALMDASPRGAMLAIPLPAEQVERLLPDGVVIGAYNARRLVVASGTEDGIAELATRVEAEGVRPRRLRVSCASHSPLMDGPAREFVEFLRDIPMGEPSVPVLSNVTGDWLSKEDARDPEYWGRHLRGAVRFTEGIARLLESVDGPLLEVGPGKGMLSLVRAAASGSDLPPLIATMRHPKDADSDIRMLLAAVAGLWEAGTEPDWSVCGPGDPRRAELPTYPFQRERFWIDRSSEEEVELSRRLMDREKEPGKWFYMPSWRRTASAGRLTGARRLDSLKSVLLITDGSGETDGIVARVTEGLSVRGIACVEFAGAGQYLRRSESRVELAIDDAAQLSLALDEEEASADSTAVVFLAGRGADADGVPDSAPALLALGKALGEKRGAAGQLLVVTRAAFDVVGTERLSPQDCLLEGIVRVLPREIPRLSCRVVDTDPAEGAEAAALAVLEELLVDDPDATVAHRSGRRWARGVEPVHVREEDRERSGALRAPRAGGTYLVTGGLGGIGLSLAEFLAREYGANLVLTGRGEFPERDAWEAWTTEHGWDDRTSRRIDKLQRLEQYGGEVLALRSDVSDADEVNALIRLVDERFGRLDGVIHAAGLPGGGLVQTLDPRAYREVLAPKVRGSRHLLAATEGRDLDFLMLFSSLNVIDGRFGIADYTSANAYLGGLAHSCRQRGRTEVVAVDWTGWRDLGMAVDAGATDEGNDELREIERLAVMSEAGMASFLSEREGHAVFLLSLAAGVPQTHISTQDLNAVVEQGRRLDVATALEVLAGADRGSAKYQRPELDTDYIAPEDDRERFICETLQMLLGIEQVGARDDFFELGGNSLLALDVTARVNKRFDTDVSVAAFLAAANARALATLTAQWTESR
ncbi:polyketide synthase [Streptomyces inusitatus]|uniref:Polyketide synthase n=1 Tax=Streptomyces inusitatus TaxID=68221 RepID=A0A918PNJ7_9ACTN|nr:type I polyketide synthase [Streptomyces inusitatus]GGZ16186.1 polyketide synthase [Streptomyces inusitatus]